MSRFGVKSISLPRLLNRRILLFLCAVVFLYVLRLFYLSDGSELQLQLGKGEENVKEEENRPSIPWGPETISFDPPRPAYLDTPLVEPMVIRLAIISHVFEFERRQVLRDTVLRGVPESDVHIEYKFIIGNPKEGLGNWTTWLQRTKEDWVYGDVHTVPVTDIPERLSEKRFGALKWADSVPHTEYDYSMTMDSDTFCRFQALARRITHTQPKLAPRTQPILIGRMGDHVTYFKNTVPDGNINEKDEDDYVRGPWYPYPLGIGYMLSSNITHTLMNISPPLPHHVIYPSDDVMIGSWIAGLRNFHDPTIKFETTERSSNPPPLTPVKPTPYLPYRIDTEVVNDVNGWHDIKSARESGTEGRIGWETVCVHRMKAPEMRALRAREELKGEWEDVIVKKQQVY
ncbi:Beta-1,3-galactosyltransferase 6 [Psilocybe cubensis]|nr:Beta-1,3-galactosyltransferase 6 [Psilocybe cubensis]KAH9479930.1 Beta-1,3-galactosyltransferase 6 [Psilocybe cubensis]